ncbi:TPA: hypothetical protein ACGPAN_001119, partial [Streptococcus suis]
QYINIISDLLPKFTQVVVFACWYILATRNRDFFNKSLHISILSFAIFLITLLRTVIADQINMDYYSPMQAVIQRYQFLIYPVIYVYICDLPKFKKKKLINLAFLSILITIAISFYYIFKVDPQAIRNTQRSIKLIGVGDFQLMYALSLITGPLLMTIFNRWGKVQVKHFFELSFIFCSVLLCLILCNLVTSVVVALISMFVTFFLNSKSKLFRFVLISVVSLLYGLKELIADSLYALANQNIFYWSTNNKIVAIANVLVGNFEQTDTLSRRDMLASQSMESFYKNPVLGIDFKNHVAGNIGGHMQWADDLARFGIFGNLIIIINYIMIAVYTIKTSKDKIVRDSMMATWITFVILGFLNPLLSGPILMMIFVVIPLLNSY